MRPRNSSAPDATELRPVAVSPAALVWEALLVVALLRRLAGSPAPLAAAFG